MKHTNLPSNARRIRQFIAPILLLALAAFAPACEKSTTADPVAFIPAGTKTAITIDLERLSEKIDWEMLREHPSLAALGDSEPMLKMLLDPKQSGLDMNREVAFYVTELSRNGTEYVDAIEVGIVAGVSVADSLDALFTKMYNKDAIERKGKTRYIDQGGSLTIWDDDLLLVRSLDDEDELGQAVANFREPPAQSLMATASYQEFRKGASADISTWTEMNPGNMLAESESPWVSLVNWDLFLDAHWGTRINFDKGAMNAGMQLFTDNEDTRQLMLDMTANSMNPELLAWAPEGVSAGMGFSMNPTAYARLFNGDTRDILIALGLEGESLHQADQMLKQIGKAWEGDLVLGFSGLSMIENSFIPELTAALSISEGDALDQLLDGLVSSGVLTREGSVYEMLDAPLPVSMARNGNAFVITTSASVRAGLVSGSMPAGAWPKMASQLMVDHPSAMWADPSLVMASVIEVQPMAFLFSGLVTKNFEAISAWSEVDKNGQLTQQIRMGMVDKDEYAINTLLRLILDISETFLNIS